jgi:hypothetical protein
MGCGINIPLSIFRSSCESPRVARLALRLVSLLVACVLALAARTALADPGSVELAAGIAARSTHPPDVATARAHFEAASRALDDKSAAEALYFLGELDYAALDFKSALAHYAASAARLPSSRYTPRANSLMSELRSHSEGDFAPLVRLETVRRSPALANDGATIDALVHDAATFPPGKVRVEARMLAAEAYQGRLGRKDDALPLLRLVAEDPKAEVLAAREAASELVASYIAKKDFSSALEVAEKYPKLLEPNTQRTIARLARRRPLRMLAAFNLFVLLAAALAVIARSDRRKAFAPVRRLAPMALVFAAVATGVGGLLASRYEQTNPYPFTTLLPQIFGIIIVARIWSAGGSPRPGARAFRAVVAFAGVFAAAFIALDRMDPIYLQGFGL